MRQATILALAIIAIVMFATPTFSRPQTAEQYQGGKVGLLQFNENIVANSDREVNPDVPPRKVMAPANIVLEQNLPTNVEGRIASSNVPVMVQKAGLPSGDPKGAAGNTTVAPPRNSATTQSFHLITLITSVLAGLWISKKIII